MKTASGPDEKQQQHARRELMNGPRPHALKIHKDSRIPHKITSTSSSSSSSSSVAFSDVVQADTARRNPLVIYTHSPKVIHTQPRDFMALVQKLTGLSHSAVDAAPPQPKRIKREETEESSSVLSDDNSFGVGTTPSSSVYPLFKTACGSPDPYDIPLYTPGSVDFLCSPAGMGMGHSLSYVDVLPEY